MQTWIVLAMIVAYFGATTAIGIIMTRRSRGSDDWAIAGRRMGLGLLVVGIAGTRVGGVATYGVAGDVISGGVWNLWYAVSAVGALAVMGWFFAKPYRRLGLQTVGEIFQVRFQSRRCQTLSSLCVQSELLIVNIIEPYVIAQILATVTGLPFGAAVACAAAGLISYTASGGLWGSATTNLVHSIAIFGGLAAVSVAGFVHLGGWSTIVSSINTTLSGSGIDESTWWHFAGTGWLPVIGMLLAAIIHTPAVSIWVNFASAARKEAFVTPAFLIAGLLSGSASLLAGLIGIETLAKYGKQAQISNYETLTRLATDVNPWLGGLAIAAVLAAVVSSGGPILLAGATMFVRDWVAASTKWSESRRLSAYRTATVVYGLLAALIAWLGPIRSILDLVLFAFAMVVPPGVAVTFILYWKRTTEAGVFWGMALGYGVSLAWHLFPNLVSANGSVIDVSYPATLIPLVVIPVVSLLTRDDTDARDSFYRRLGAVEVR